jgi:uncharacterized membrane protein
MKKRVLPQRRFMHFLQTTLIGGLAAILPMGLIVILLRWIIKLIERYLEPLVALFETNTRLSTIIVYIIAVAAIITLFFFIGLFIRTRFGKFMMNHIEKKYLSKIPGYSTAREIVQQFFGGNKKFFSEVVLVDIFDTGVLMTGFITDYQEWNEYITVFVPTGPNPTSGNIYHLPRNRVRKSEATVDYGLKTIISCGAGSSEVFKVSSIPYDKINQIPDNETPEEPNR